MKKTNQKKIIAFRGEKLLYIVIMLMILSFPMLTVFSQSMLAKSNIEIERLRKTIIKQENLNESLSMQINELASLDKIQDIAKEQGLSYNNDNIRLIKNN